MPSYPFAAARRWAWLVVLVPFTVAVSAQRGPATPPPGVSTPGVRIPMEALKPDAVYDIPGAPDWMVVDDDVWISNAPKNSVTRVDPRTNAVVSTIAVGARPCSGLAAGFGSLWVPNCGDKTFSRIDLHTGVVSATVASTIGNSEGGVATGAGSFWMMTDANGTLARIDPATNAVVATIATEPGSFAVAFADDAVWVTNTTGNRLMRVDPKTNRVEETIPVGPRPRFLTVGGGSVWTLNQGDGSITRVDAHTNRVLATIPAGLSGAGGEIAFGEGSVWATVLTLPLTRIDVATNTVAQQFFGAGGDSVRVGHGSVWLSDLRGGKLMRFDVKKIVATQVK